MESLPWIESNFLVNARKWQEHDVAAESTTGLFGGLSGTTFAVEICLNFQVNRNGELDVSREQTADCNTRDCLRNLCCQFPLCLWRMLPFLTAWSIFLFLHLYSTLAFTLSSKVLYFKKTATLNFWFVSIQAPACFQVCFHPLFSRSVLHAPLLSPAFFIQKNSQLLCKFQ